MGIHSSFQELREYSTWTSRNGVVQTFFQASTRNMFAEKFIKWVGFWPCWGSIFFYNVEWLEVPTTSEVFWVKLCWEMSHLFCQFMLASRLSVKKSGIKDKFQNMRFWISYFLVQISFFLGSQLFWFYQLFKQRSASAAWFFLSTWFT